MTLFFFPKTKHTRHLQPRQFKRYQTYKRYLQVEFSRLCVYCRQPDSSAPNINMGVDHYRPKGIRRFASLVCEWTNLYYCCGACNSRKNNYWPVDESKDPFIVNPCDFVMAAHLRYDSKTGVIDAHNQSKHGEWTRDLLQLNDDVSVNYRKATQKTVALFDKEINAALQELSEIQSLLKDNKITKAQYDQDEAAIQAELVELRAVRATHTGELPLASLPTQRRGVLLGTFPP
ncbi:hypothetical protein [Burkholderia cepacia]|uniref:hypothetical protein n=1 Tax=Burkholderia cepacia TaxID=292 RepID=UPI000A906790|nr:hypothetical protein [Burkholderia cepacia]